jgi:glycolate oxidase iron-sulfur subunit
VTWHRKPLKELVDRCFRCGLCRAVCPVFLQDGREPAVARARLQLIAALSNGQVQPGERLACLLSRCLTCGACEAICPADVAVTEAVLRSRGELVTALELVQSVSGHTGRTAQGASAEVAPDGGGRDFDRTFREQPSAGLIDDSPAEGVLPRWRRYLRALRSRPERPLAAVLGLISGHPAGESSEDHEAAADGLPRAVGPADAQKKIAYFPGCADLLWPRLWQATFELFRRAGIQAVVPPGTYCCGYPFLEAGDPDPARRLVNENIKAFEKLEVEAIVTGCSTGARMLGRYTGEILGLTGFPVPVLELGEFLIQLAQEDQFPRLEAPVEARIAYLQPRGLGRSVDGAMELFNRVDQLEPVLLEDDLGCGGSLFFAALHPERHEQIMERTVGAIVDLHCRAVAAHSPLTMFLLDRYLESHGIDLRVVHLAEILDMACKNS